MRTWAEVKRAALAEIATLQGELESAPLDQVLLLQTRIQVIRQIIAWFEAGSPDDRRIGDDVSTYS